MLRTKLETYDLSGSQMPPPMAPCIRRAFPSLLGTPVVPSPPPFPSPLKGEGSPCLSAYSKTIFHKTCNDIPLIYDYDRILFQIHVKIFGEGGGVGARRQNLGPNPRDWLAAKLAFPLFQVDLDDVITLAGDEDFLAFGTERPFPFVAGDVANVNIL